VTVAGAGVGTINAALSATESTSNRMTIVSVPPFMASNACSPVTRAPRSELTIPPHAQAAAGAPVPPTRVPAVSTPAVSTAVSKRNPRMRSSCQGGGLVSRACAQIVATTKNAISTQTR